MNRRRDKDFHQARSILAFIRNKDGADIHDIGKEFGVSPTTARQMINRGRTIYPSSTELVVKSPAKTVYEGLPIGRQNTLSDCIGF